MVARLFAVLLFMLVCVAAWGQPVQPPGLSKSANLSDVPNPAAAHANLRYASQRPPLPTDDTTKGYGVGDLWCVPESRKCWVATTSVAARAALWLPLDIGNALPLDIAAAAGYTASGWWGDQLATRNANVLALNKWADWWRKSDGTTKTIGWAANGDGDWAAVDAFCAGATSCEKTKNYDQSFNISTLALNGNDATATPGYIANTAVVATGGSGCTNGAQTFTFVGGTAGTPSQVAGTVTANALAGALTVPVPGSYSALPSPITLGNGQVTSSVTGGGCSVAPTVRITFRQQAPLNKLNTINGHRATSFTGTYSPGDTTLQSGLPGGNQEWMDLPAGVSTTQNSTTLFNVVHPRFSFNTRNVLITLGAGAGDFNTNINAMYSTSPFQPTPMHFTHTGDTPFASPASPAVWAWQLIGAGTSVSVGNQTEMMTFGTGNAAKTGGALGAGVAGGGRPAFYDFLHAGIFNAIINAATMTNMKASLNLLTGMTPQSTDTIVIVGDSIAVDTVSVMENNWAKYMLSLGMLPSNPIIVNTGVAGASYLGSGIYDFATNFNTMWAPIYRANRNFFPLMVLGRNDLLVGTPAPPVQRTIFLRAQAYAASLAGLGPNVFPLAGTVLPDVSKIVSDNPTYLAQKAIIDAYNVLIRNCARVGRTSVTAACPDGGLGVVGVMDFAADPLWSSPAANDNSFTYSPDGTHPKDTGSQDMAGTAAPVLLQLIQ